MITNYPYRDYFYDGDKKKNILIVPQGTQVIPREGKEPKIKVYDEETHTFVNQDTNHPLKFYITNHNIIKEQFSITESINSPDDLAFGSCEPGQVKFTIRNDREIDPDGNVVDIVPPLTSSDLKGTEFTSWQEIFKLYIYFDDDSLTMMYVGMYKVQEDKMSADQKSRDIVAYDYLYELRDMDISNWYKRLFTGTTTATNDKEDEEEESNSKNQNEGEEEETDEKEEGGLEIKKGKEHWTILEALTDLFQELCTNDSIDKCYPGYGLKMWFDEEVIKDKSEMFPNLYKYAFTQNKNFIDKSYSLGKFFEDIGVLIGAYPKVMRGVPGADGWCDQLKGLKHYTIKVPNTEKTAVIDQDIYVEDYCILTYIPIANKNEKIDSDHVIKEFRMLKGISSEAYAVGSINLLRAKNSDGKVINHYTNISDTDLIDAYNSCDQKVVEKFYEDGKNKFKKAVILYDITNNLFLSHLGVKFKEQKDEKTSDNSSSSTTNENNTKSRGAGDDEPTTAKVITKKNCKTILQNAFQKINRRTYTPFKVECIGDLCVETGDRIRFRNHFDELYSTDFKSYILTRTLSGIQKMIDKYEAKGSNGLPNFGNYKSGASYDSGSYGGSKISSTEPDKKTTPDKEDTNGNVVAEDFNSTDFVEIIRNIGYRLLDEPEVTKCVYSKKHKKVFMRWSDPADITTNEPLPAEWVGTVVVRKEGSAPLHKWDGTIIVDSKVRDQYKNTSYEDNTAEKDKDYYYGFFPYHLAISDTSIPVYHYRFTKVMHVVSGEVEKAPSIKSISTRKDPSSNNNRNTKAAGSGKYKATVTYELPEDDYEYAVMVTKEGSDPESATDGIAVPITSSEESVVIRGLKSKTEYHYKIFTSLNESNEAIDNTGDDETVWDYDYTGEIEEFTAPYTGTYKLETWGAQGGNAIYSDEIVARGGYGSYSVGEVNLNAGDKIYIGVGGQNGWNGGGTEILRKDIPSISQAWGKYHLANYVDFKSDNDNANSVTNAYDLYKDYLDNDTMILLGNQYALPVTRHGIATTIIDGQAGGLTIVLIPFTNQFVQSFMYTYASDGSSNHVSLWHITKDEAPVQVYDYQLNNTTSYTAGIETRYIQQLGHKEANYLSISVYGEHMVETRGDASFRLWGAYEKMD